MGFSEGYDGEITLNEIESSCNDILRRNRPGTALKVILNIIKDI